MKSTGIVWRLLQALGALSLVTGCSANVDEVEAPSSTTEGIIGGSNAAVGGWPWMVELFNNTDPANNGPCGATLISPDWVVTAAHCVSTPNSNGVPQAAQPFNIYMYLGEYDRSGFGAPSEGGNWERGKFGAEVHLHPGYVATSPGHNDIALIKLDTTAILNARVKPIAITNAVVNSGTGIAAGWGATASQNPSDPATLSSAILQRASLTVRTTAVCNSSPVGAIRHLFSDEMCAGNSNGNPSACFGDSGGPLIRANGSSYELIGVTSWGTNYCTSYTVFSRISSAYSWIRSYVP